MDREAVILAVGAAVFGGWLRSVYLRHQDRKRRRIRARRAHRGELEAEALVESHGWEVVGRQVERQYALIVDGSPRTFTVRADLLLRRRGVLAVGETKTGSRVARLEHGPTRRQLLEYGHVFQAREALLIDVLGQSVTRVVVPAPPSARPVPWGAALVAAAVVLLLLMA